MGNPTATQTQYWKQSTDANYSKMWRIENRKWYKNRLTLQATHEINSNNFDEWPFNLMPLLYNVEPLVSSRMYCRITENPIWTNVSPNVYIQVLNGYCFWVYLHQALYFVTRLRLWHSNCTTIGPCPGSASIPI